MDKDAHEINKNKSLDNIVDWLKNMMIVEYGEITHVYDACTVSVQLLVKHDFAPKVFRVRLVSIGSSRLVENVTMPQEHDQVLLLFFRSHDDLMFQNPEARALESEENDATITTNEVNRYNGFSGVGVLAKTASGMAPTTLAHYTDPTNGPTIDFSTNARVMAALKKAVSLVFDVQAGAEGSTPANEAINVIFGKHSPMSVEQRGGFKYMAAEGAATEIGFGKNATLSINLADGALVTVESADGLTEHYAKAVSITCDKEITLAGVGMTIDAKTGKVSLKNNSANLKSALDSTLGDCSSLVSALNTFVSVASQTAITTAGAAPLPAPLAAALVALMATLASALAALGFTADKTTIDSILK